MDYRTLVKDCLKQKPAAQRQLYEHFAPTMLAVCYRYTKSIKDSEDILQEGFIKVFRNLGQFRFEGELGGWIRRVIVTTALNYLKRNRKYQNDLSFEDLSLHPVSDDNPIVRMEAKELADLIRQLPTGYQTIFNLYAIEGYTHVEIAEMLGISEGTSKSQYSRARALLIQWIEKHSSFSKKENYGRK